MKRLFFILLFFSTLFLFGCAHSEYGILEYQNNDITAVCTVNGEYNVSITKRKDYSALVINEPSEVSGVCFELFSDGAFVSIDNVTIPIEESKLSGICALIGIFDLDESELTSTAAKNGESLFVFSNGYGTYNVIFGQNSMPQSVQLTNGVYTFDVTIESISLE